MTQSDRENEKRNALLIIKRNIENLKNQFKRNYMNKWEISPEKVQIENNSTIETYRITQNLFSLPLIWENQFFKDAKTHFFLELINLFQTLEGQETNKNIFYRSHSQSLTSYCLKILARQNIIEIINWEKQEIGFLSEFEQMFGKNKSNDISYYDVIFYKKRDLMMTDLPMIECLAKGLKIDFNQYKVSNKSGKIKLSLKTGNYKWKGLSRIQIEMIKDILESIIQDVFSGLRKDIKDKEKTLKKN